MRLLSLSEASIEPRTSALKFARAPCTDRPGCAQTHVTPDLPAAYFNGSLRALLAPQALCADIDNVLMILAASRQMDHRTRKIVTKRMMQGKYGVRAGTTVSRAFYSNVVGFNDHCLAAGTKVFVRGTVSLRRGVGCPSGGKFTYLLTARIRVIRSYPVPTPMAS